MLDLWKELSQLFDTDDGSLPDLRIEPLSVEQIRRIYSWVRSIAPVYGDPTIWDEANQRDVPITGVSDPIEWVATGRNASFRHGLEVFRFDGVEIPQLTIAVYPDSVELDYRIGPEWGPRQLNALFALLWSIQQMAPEAAISHVDEGASSPTASFSKVWAAYARLRSASPL